MIDSAKHTGQYRRGIAALLLFVVCLCFANEARPAEVIVVGDTRLKPVVEVIAGIRSSVKKEIEVYAPSETRAGKLSKIVKQEGALTVIALGQESLEEALSLPPEITVLYTLVILPPKTSRQNTTGVYMGTPIREYLKVIDSYLPDLKKISVIGSPEVLEVLDHSNRNHLMTYRARNAFDFVSIVKKLKKPDALLLLPDISLLTKTALEESYLFSFRKKVPLLGISKKHVRQGALFALEFDPEKVGRRLGSMAAASLEGKVFAQGQALPSQNFSLYINRETAKKMGISIPEEMIKIAAGVFP
ncbi:MAG: hypothetical protein JRF02_06895 [Deltaproteobacteria bacterium]|jgi:hypothetical protein|nr:hypothetical protein [Deltaproteobacteria bacterium]